MKKINSFTNIGQQERIFRSGGMGRIGRIGGETLRVGMPKRDPIKSEYVRGIIPQHRYSMHGKASSNGGGTAPAHHQSQTHQQYKPSSMYPYTTPPHMRHQQRWVTAKQQPPPSTLRGQERYMYIPPRTFQEPSGRGYDPYR